MIYTIYDKILVKNEYILRKGWIRLWKKNHMDAERARETIEMIVTEYNRIDVGIYISLVCKRYMDEYNMDEDELFFRLSNSMNRLLNEEK